MKNKIVYLSTFLLSFSFISNLYSELPIFGPGSSSALLSQYREKVAEAAIGAGIDAKIDFNEIKNLLNKIENNFKDRVANSAHFREFVSQNSFYPSDKINLEGAEAVKQFTSRVMEKRLSVDDISKEEFDVNRFNDLATKFAEGRVTKEVFESGKNRFLAQIEKDKKATAKDVKVVPEAAPISKALDERVKTLEAQANDYDQLKQNALKHIKDRLNAFLAKAATISVAKEEVFKFKEYVQQIIKDLNESNLNSFNFNKLAILENINDKLGHVQTTAFGGYASINKTVLAEIKKDFVKYDAILKDEESKKRAEERKQKAEAGAAQKEEDEAEISKLIKEINGILPSVPQNSDKNILLKAFDAAQKEAADLDTKSQRLEEVKKLALAIKVNNFMAVEASKRRLKNQLGISI